MACRNCGNDFDVGHKQVCPARGKSCRSCGKLNHFAKVFRSSTKAIPQPRATEQNTSINYKNRRVHATTEETQDSSSSDGFYFTLTSQTQNDYIKTVTKTPKDVMINTNMNSADVQLTLDSSATKNVIDNASSKRICKNDEGIELLST